MKSEFRHENFEDFLKRSADNLRMKAPEGVWKNISGELNKGKRRFGISLSAFFLVASILGYLTISNNTRSFRLAEQTPSALPSTTTNTSEDNRTSLTAGKSQPSELAMAGRGGNETGITLISNGRIPAGAPIATTAPTTETQEATAATAFEPTPVDDYPNPTADASVNQQQPINLLAAVLPANTSPWTIESVTNARLKRRWKESRWQTQYHFTPTISYRKLSENKSYLRKTPQALSQPNYNTLYNNVNSMVTHKPALGFEVGITEKYAVSQTVRIKLGVQFNVNRYEIKAFHSPYALTAIALNNRRSARVDSLWTVANYSNVDVTRTNRGSWLQNYSFQVSAPVGVELNLKGNEKMQFGIATSIQPTYVLGDRAYMITSDYKSYTQVPWLLRRWNVNTAFETFVSYQSGKTRWQVGPQVRYQLLSSFISNYPVKENLFDFGLKIGVSLNK